MTTPPQATASPTPRSVPLLVLGIVGIVLLVTTVALGGLTAWLLLTRGASAPGTAPTPQATATPSGSTQLVRGLEVTVSADPALEFDSFTMSDVDEGGFVSLVTPVTWTNQTDAITVFFDITAYDAQGDIINRNPSSFYALPGQETLFIGIFSEDLSDAVRLTVEQTKADIEPPMMTGGITVEATESGDKSYVGARIASGLSTVPEYPTVHMVAYRDGELFGYCSDFPDIPVGGTFIVTCKLIALSSDGEPWFTGKFPKDAEYRALLELEIPF